MSAVGEAYSIENPESGSLLVNVRMAGVSATGSNQYIPVRITDGEYFDGLKPTTDLSFGDTVVVERTPVVQTDFVFGISSLRHRTRTGYGGTVSLSGSAAAIANSSTAYSFASLSTHDRIKYRPGQGAMARWTAIYDTPEIGSTQISGPGQVESAISFGYPTGSLEFSVIHKKFAQAAVKTLLITTPSTTAETAYVIIDGVSASVTLTNNGSTTTTANEIAAGDYSAVGLYGWDAQSSGSTVTFVSRTSYPAVGSFSLVATTAVGTFSTVVTGSAAVTDVYPQSEWNIDKMDGSGSSGMILNPQLGNIYQAAFDYLGYGGIVMSIEDPQRSKPIPVHVVRYANANVDPLFYSTVFPLQWAVASVGSTTPKTMKALSGGMFIQGKLSEIYGSRYSMRSSKTAIPTTGAPLLSITPKLVFNGRPNFTKCEPLFFSVGVEGTKPVEVILVKGASLTGAVWSSVSDEESITLFDTSATAYTGGELVASFVLGKSDSFSLDLEKLAIILHGFPDNDRLTIFIRATASTVDASCALVWREET